MKTRSEILIDEIVENEKKICELRAEIEKREEKIRVARANLIEYGKVSIKGVKR